MVIRFFVRTLNERKGGGSHHNAISFIRYLKARGHTVEVHAFSSLENEPPSDIPVIEHGGERHGFQEANHVLAELMKTYENGTDCYFLYSPDFSWGGGLYKRLGGQVHTVVYLDNYLFSMPQVRIDLLQRGVLARTKEWIKNAMYRLKRAIWDRVFGLALAQHVDQYLAVSPFIEKTYATFGFPKEKFATLPNFFSLTLSAPKATAEPMLLYAGRIMYDKGPDLLVSALSALTSIPWQLRIVGDGPMIEDIKAMVDEAGLVGRVTFRGWVGARELENEYKTAHIFVHPARWPEPFGRTIVEALAHGLSVVVPRVGGAAWIANNPETAFQNGSVSDLIRVLKKLLQDPAMQQRAVERGQKRLSSFSTEALGPELEKYLKKATN